MYTARQITEKFENETDIIKRIYISCHLLVVTMLNPKDGKNVSKEEYFESMIFTCYYLINKLANSDPQTKEKLYKCFVSSLSEDMIEKQLFEDEFSASIFIFNRIETIKIELTSENIQEDLLLPLLVNNLYFEPFNDDGNDDEFVMHKISFEKLVELDRILKTKIQTLIATSNDMKNMFN